jgi:CRP/FNR family transcriptional regulator, cyclic AMP receptor protein
VRHAMAYEDLLAATEFFDGVDQGTLARLEKEGTVRDLVRGDVLFVEGEQPDDLYIVVAGRVAIANRSIDGRESVYALMEPGDLFGEMSLLDGLPRSAEARALEPSSVLALPYPPVRALFDADPAKLWGVVRMLSGRLRAVDEALSDSVFLDVTGRTAKRLLELADGKDEFVLPVTQEELAGMVGASRERVNKAIASFIRLGWLEQQDRRYRILQRDRLALRSR